MGGVEEVGVKGVGVKEGRRVGSRGKGVGNEGKKMREWCEGGWRRRGGGGSGEGARVKA